VGSTGIGVGEAPDVASWLELETGAFAHNLGVFRAVLGPGVRVGAVVKGNAYGHGLAEVLPAVHGAADALYTITAGEALAIRAFEAEHGLARRDALVLGPISPREGVVLARAGVAVVAADPGFEAVVAALRTAGAPRLDVHVHVDTGLSREGFLPDDEHGLAFLARSPDAIGVTGVLTHFADVEDVTEQAWAREQLGRFDRGVATLRRVVGDVPLVRHSAASAAALVLPESRFEAVRVGISAYGLWPSRETRIGTRVVQGALPELRPVLSWRCRSQLVKTVPAGSYVSYGCTHRCADDTRVAVLPVGYYDGYPRHLSGRAHVLVRGRRCPVLGRVMMNHVVVDLGAVSGVSDGDEVVATLIGTDGDERVTADDLAGWAGTINYEVVTRIAEHVRREVRG
jgi:alanine racemase